MSCLAHVGLLLSRKYSTSMFILVPKSSTAPAKVLATGNSLQYKTILAKVVCERGLSTSYEPEPRIFLLGAGMKRNVQPDMIRPFSTLDNTNHTRSDLCLELHASGIVVLASCGDVEQNPGPKR